MVTPVIHPKTEPLRELVALLDKAPVTLVKLAYARELLDKTLTVLAETLHAVDRLETRVATLERFPEMRS
jgi:hypothetical protein